MKYNKAFFGAHEAYFIVLKEELGEEAVIMGSIKSHTEGSQVKIN